MRDDYVKKIGDESKSSSEKIIDYLNEKDYEYIDVCHQDFPSSKEGEGSSLYCTLNSEKEHNISCEKELEMMEYAKTHRHLYKLTGDQHLFMGVAWIIDQEQRRLDLFPEVIHVDGTMNTNDEKCPLFTVTGKDRLAHFFTVMRAFLPNTKAWAFRWLFKVVFPSFIRIKTLLRIKIIIYDGDSSEYTQIDAAIKEVITRCEAGC